MEAIIEGIGWPHVSLIFGIVFILVFRKPLGNFISNITSIDKSGIKTTSTPEAQRENTN